MNRIIYRSILAGAALMAGTLVTLPLWDYYHYGQPGAVALPTSRTTLATITGPQMPMFHRPAGPAAPPRPAAGTVPAPIPDPSLAPADRRSDGQIHGPAPAPDVGRPGRATPAAKAAASIAPVPGRPATGESRPRIGPAPVGREVDEGSRPPAGGSPKERPHPAVNQAPPSTWIPGAGFPGAPSILAPGAESAATNPDGPPQSAGGRQSESPATDPGPGDSSSLRLNLTPDRHAVDRGETISVRVVLTGARDVTSVPFHIQFDPAVLEYVGTRTGPALNNRSLQPIFLASVNPDRPGDLAVGLSFVRSSGAFSGSGAILLIDFRAMAAGTSDLRFDRASVRGATSEILPAEIVGSTATVR